MLSTWIDFYKIVNILQKGPLSLKELSIKTKINIEKLNKIFKEILEQGVDLYFDIFLFEDEKQIFGLEEATGRLENIVVKIRAGNNEKFLYTDIGLDKRQQWELYDFLTESKHDYISSEKAKILQYIENDDLKNKHKQLASMRVLKKNFNIFNINENLILKLYEFINEEIYINLYLQSNEIYDVFPKSIVFDEEIEEWYLSYIKKKKLCKIKLSSINEVKKSNYKNGAEHRKIINYKKCTKIKIRVFNEKDANTTAIRYVVRKDIIESNICEEFTEYTLRIEDVNRFLRWVRNMSPEVIIIEPEFLRKRMIKEILEWEKIYK